MLALITFVVISSGVAAGLGYIVYLITRRKIRTSWLRAIISLFSGVVILLATAVVFIFYGFLIPATDSQVLVGKQQHLRISLFPGPSDSAVMQDKGYDIEIFAPESTGIDQDFSFRLSVSDFHSPAALPSLTAILSFPASVQARTLNSCGNKSIPGIASDVIAACSPNNENSDRSRFSLTWDVTPTRAGSVVLAAELLDFPPADGPIDISGNWQASLELNGNEVFSNENETYVGPIRGSAGGVTFIPFFLTPGKPSVQISNFYLDLSSMQVRVPVQVKNTLGVSGRTYTLLALAGSILAGALGTGWFWQLVQIVRNRKNTGS